MIVDSKSVPEERQQEDRVVVEEDIWLEFNKEIKVRGGQSEKKQQVTGNRRYDAALPRLYI